MTTISVTFDLHGTSFGGGDDEASIIFIQNNNWYVANIISYGTNGLNAPKPLLSR